MRKSPEQERTYQIALAHERETQRRNERALRLSAIREALTVEALAEAVADFIENEL